MPKPKPTFLYEHMAQFHWDSRFVVRMWIKTKSSTDMEVFAAVDNVTHYLNANIPPNGPSAAAEQLARNFNHLISAVEVTSANGHGLVVYIDWP